MLNKSFNVELMLVAGFTVMGLAFSLILSGVVNGATIVPGQQRSSLDKDHNGYPDVGVTVNGHYTSVYAYDDTGNWYWDLGDGRIVGTVDSIGALDEESLTTCNYEVNYRGNFENNPFLDNGWIQNHINCSGFDDNNEYNYLIVNQSDPRYTGNPDWAIWGNWEYHTLTTSHIGNLVRPYKL